MKQTKTPQEPLCRNGRCAQAQSRSIRPEEPTPMDRSSQLNDPDEWLARQAPLPPIGSSKTRQLEVEQAITQLNPDQESMNSRG